MRIKQPTSPLSSLLESLRGGGLAERSGDIEGVLKGSETVLGTLKNGEQHNTKNNKTNEYPASRTSVDDVHDGGFHGGEGWGNAWDGACEGE